MRLASGCAPQFLSESQRWNQKRHSKLTRTVPVEANRLGGLESRKGTGTYMKTIHENLVLPLNLALKQTNKQTNKKPCYLNTQLLFYFQNQVCVWSPCIFFKVVRSSAKATQTTFSRKPSASWEHAQKEVNLCTHPHQAIVIIKWRQPSSQIFP